MLALMGVRCSSAGGHRRTGGASHPQPQAKVLPDTVIPIVVAERVGRCVCGQTAEMLPQWGGCWGKFLQKVTVYRQLRGWP